MKKVSKKAFNDLIASVVMLFRERKCVFLSRDNGLGFENYVDRVNYVESVESLLLSFFMLKCPNKSSVYDLECLRSQIKEIMV